MICPKCGSKVFRDVKVSLDGEADEVEVIDKICNNCSLYYDCIGYNFYEGVKTYLDIEGKEPFKI